MLRPNQTPPLTQLPKEEAKAVKNSHFHISSQNKQQNPYHTANLPWKTLKYSPQITQHMTITSRSSQNHKPVLFQQPGHLQTLVYSVITESMLVKQSRNPKETSCRICFQIQSEKDFKKKKKSNFLLNWH